MANSYSMCLLTMILHNDTITKFKKIYNPLHNHLIASPYLLSFFIVPDVFGFSFLFFVFVNQDPAVVHILHLVVTSY